MLDFFRKYQRYFFLVITVVIIISFSFFGTYSTLGSNNWREQIAFTAVDGREVTRSDVDELALFLATDREDKMVYGGAWGPNFLNDGVIRKDFLETGLGEELALAFQADLQPEMDKRLAKEKKFVLYSHPQAPFLSVANVWNYFAPEMNTHFNALKAAQNGLDPAAFRSRVNLYLGQRQMPEPTLKYILDYQAKQYNWLQPDATLYQTDLSLFGYHTVEDWFGSHFTRLVSQFIINAAILAEQQGYEVSRAEALADLVRNTQISYQQNLNNPNLGVTSPEEYLNEQLRRLNMDQARAIKTWRQVLLFRRYFHDAGAVALVDALVSDKLHHFAHDNIQVEIYRLPAALKLSNFDELQQFETYLQAVAKGHNNNSTELPQEYQTVAEITKIYPELVQKQYQLEVAEANQKSLQARIGLRELWNWEVDDANWGALTNQFSVLSAKKGDSRDERFAILDGLDAASRAKIDTFAKEAIVKANPVWIDQALSSAKPHVIALGLRMQGGKMPFRGLEQKKDREAFTQLLDQAPLGEAPGEDSPLYHYSADQQNFYRITVISKGAERQILTFAEARADDTMVKLRDRQLEKHYKAVRDQNPTLYQNENKEWQPYRSVKEIVAKEYYEKLLKALEPIQKSLAEGSNQKSGNKDQAAALRFYPHVKTIKEALEKQVPEANQWISSTSVAENLAPGAHLSDQWKIEKKSLTVDRFHNEEPHVMVSAFEMQPEGWSTLNTPVDGDLSFYQVISKGKGDLEPTAVAEQVRDEQFLLGAEAQRQFMRQVLQKLKSTNAISLAYMNTPNEEPQQAD